MKLDNEKHTEKRNGIMGSQDNEMGNYRAYMKVKWSNEEFTRKWNCIMRILKDTDYVTYGSYGKVWPDTTIAKT